MPHNINVRFHAIYDLFLADLDNGGIRVGMVGGEIFDYQKNHPYRDWETDRKSTRLNSSHSAKSRMPSSA